MGSGYPNQSRDRTCKSAPTAHDLPRAELASKNDEPPEQPGLSPKAPRSSVVVARFRDPRLSPREPWVLPTPIHVDSNQSWRQLVLTAESGSTAARFLDAYPRAQCLPFSWRRYVCRCRPQSGCSSIPWSGSLSLAGITCSDDERTLPRGIVARRACRHERRHDGESDPRSPCPGRQG